MTAITLTEISVEDVVSNVAYGTATRRVMVFVRGTVEAGGSGTLNLSTYVPSIADVQGVLFCTDDNVAQVPTDVSWSTVTITVVDAGVAEVGLICTLT